MAEKFLTGIVVQARKDNSTGRQFYIDHNTRKTTWARPKSQPPPISDTPAPSSLATDQESAEEANTGSSNAASEGEGPLTASSSSHRGEFGLFGLGLDEVDILFYVMYTQG